MRLTEEAHPPHVVLFTDADVFAGTERHMLDLARGLRQAGVAATLACPSPSALEEAAAQEGLPFLAVPKRGLLDWAAARTLAGRLRGGAADVIHAHNGRTALAAAVAVGLAGRGRLVTTQHFLEPNHATLHGPKAFVSRLAHHWVTHRTDRVIAISEAVRQAMLSRHEAPDGKITVIPNGISDPTLAAGSSARCRWERELGIEVGAPLVVCAARLEPEKDVASLIEAMGRVAAALPGVRCVIAGEGALRADLEAQAQRLGLADTVRLLGFRTDAPALIAAADVFVLPSLAEPFGLVLLEAMALGRPVVATAAGGPLEIVVDGETGLLVPPAAPAALADALLAILADPESGPRMGRSGQARFREMFTADRMARATLAVYHRASGVASAGEDAATLPASPERENIQSTGGAA